MMENGLIEEVKSLLNMGYTKDMISMQGIGYKEIIKYLEGEYELDEAIEIIKRDSRRYAKRQLTWFRRYDDAKWFNLDEYNDSEILKQDVISYIEKKPEVSRRLFFCCAISKYRLNHICWHVRVHWSDSMENHPEKAVLRL